MAGKNFPTSKGEGALASTYYLDVDGLAEFWAKAKQYINNQNLSLNGQNIPLYPRGAESNKSIAAELQAIWAAINGDNEFSGIIGESGSHTHTVTGSVTSDIEVTVNNEMFTVEYSAGVLALNGLMTTGCEAGVLSLSRNSSSTVTGSVTSTLNEITTSEDGSHTHNFE